MFTEGWERERVWKQRSLGSGPSVGSGRGRSERGGEYKSPRQTRGLHTFQDVLAPPRPSNNGIKAIGPKSAVYWLGDLGQVKLSVPLFPHL